MFQHELLLLKMQMLFQSLEMFQHELLLLKMSCFSRVWRCFNMNFVVKMSVFQSLRCFNMNFCC